MKNFEKEYKKMLQEELPDFWNRIEAGIAEREKRLSGGVNMQGMRPEEEEGMFFGSERADILPRKSHWQKYALLAAACLCVAVVIPAIYAGLDGNQVSTSAPMDKSAYAEMAASSETSVEPDFSAEERTFVEEEVSTEAGVSMEAESAEETTEAGVSEKAPAMADGTVATGIEINIVEVSQMKYHTVYRVSVIDGNGVFSVGEELEILTEAEQKEIWAEGETYQVDLIYDSRWEIPFRPFKNGE